MQVASLELCKELYELSGWNNLPLRHSKQGVFSLEPFPPDLIPLDFCPAYDLGYLLRKLLPNYGKVTLTHDAGHNQWWATDVIGHAVFEADTPENAACKLAIELFKQGVLKKEN